MSLYAFTKDTRPLDFPGVLVDILWTRPAPSHSLKEVDAFIEWARKMGISKQVIDIGLELEISFHMGLVSAALSFEHITLSSNYSVSQMANDCFNGAEEISTTYAMDICKQKPFFGPYRLLEDGTLVQEIPLRIYRIIGTGTTRDIFFVANWTLGKGITMFYDVGISSAVKLARHYRIVTMEEPPFIERYKLSSDSTWQYEGYCIDLLNLIANALNFTYEIYTLPKRSLGQVNAIGRVDGLVSEVYDGNAHIALAPIETSPHRELFVDFSYPLYEARGLAVLLKVQQEIEPPGTLVTIVSWPVWLCLLVVFCVTSILLHVFDYCSPFSQRNNTQHCGIECPRSTSMNLVDSFWFCLMSFTTHGGGQIPRNMSGRIIVTAWWLFVFSMFSSYSANLAAKLKYVDGQTQLETLEQLLKQTNIFYAVVAGTEEARYFERLSEIELGFRRRLSQAVEDPLLDLNERLDKYFWDYPFQVQYEKVWKFMNQVGLPENYEEGVRRVLQSSDRNGSFALIGNSALLEYAVSRFCHLRIIQSEVYPLPRAVALQQQSSLVIPVNSQMSHFARRQEIKSLEKKWWAKHADLENCAPINEDVSSVSAGEIYGVFILIMLGTLLSCCTVLFQAVLCWRKKKHNVGVHPEIK
uniref:Ionotropic glutamate receptor C-terminal domain-containing protein n=1 Tax=Trichuris muris TaxID=70415 RepID=A0A5S6QRF9_TRIMR